MIIADALEKSFRVPLRAPGFSAAVRSLFRRETRDVRAVAGVSFRIEPGERVGFLGPNGAGKTTTLKMLAGLLVPSAGRVSVAGETPSARRESFLKRVTLVLGQKQQLVWDLPPQDTFELNRAIFGISEQDFRKHTGTLIERLGIGEVVRRPTRQLSLGERMKCELACALIHRPTHLFLDEPTIGLDVNVQEDLRKFILEYNQEHGASLLLTSHYMNDVAALCPRIIIIDGGKKRYDGALRDLPQAGGAHKRVTLRFQRAVAEDDLVRYGTVVTRAETTAVLRVAPTEVARVLAALLADLPVADLSVTDPPLEETLGTLFGHKDAGITDIGKPDRP